MTRAEMTAAGAALAEAIGALPVAERAEVLNDVRASLHAVSPFHEGPVDLVRWIPMDRVQGNDYNPNSVAKVEMTLLLRSIAHDGYTQPVVTVYDAALGKYVVVDGFHRTAVMRMNAEVRERFHGHLPLVVLEKGINDRMASTVRHNRARGKHSVHGMANMVFQMLENGWADAAICNELGMEPEELLRIKHITGFSKLFADAQYNRAWTTRNQIRLKRAQAAKEAGVVLPDEEAPL